MAFHNVNEHLYLETDVLGVSFRASLLQVRDGMKFPKDEACNNIEPQPIAFTSKSLTSAETWYSNSVRKGSRHNLLPIKVPLQLLCLEVSVILDHKPQVAIIKRDVSSLSHRLKNTICITNTTKG